jgi:hypothetical protein
MEDFTVKKTIVTYEGLLQNLETEFAKLTQHFDQPLDNNRLEQEAAKITKSRVKDKTQHDPQVVQLKETYNTARETFKKDYAGLIWDCLIKDRADLLNYFDDEVYRRG